MHYMILHTHHIRLRLITIDHINAHMHALHKNNAYATLLYIAWHDMTLHTPMHTCIAYIHAIDTLHICTRYMTYICIRTCTHVNTWHACIIHAYMHCITCTPHMHPHINTLHTCITHTHITCITYNTRMACIHNIRSCMSFHAFHALHALHHTTSHHITCITYMTSHTYMHCIHHIESHTYIH